jgi:peptide/nickel transport system permease protein
VSAALDGPAPSLADRTIGLMRRSGTATAGALILLGFGLLAIFAPLIAPWDPVLPDLNAILSEPSAAHRLGTDSNGMDILSRTIHGSRYAFLVALPSVGIAVLIGVPAGLLAGYRGGWVDEALVRIADAMRIFPSIILALAVVAVLGPSLLNVVLVIGLLDAAVFARVVRAEALALRAGSYVDTAVAVGNPTRRILFVHLLPNAIQGATAMVAIRAAWAVRISATLAFLGVGIQAPAPEWGAMIRLGAEFMVTGQWWVGVPPGLALILMVVGLNLLGDGLQDVLDPRRRAAAR